MNTQCGDRVRPSVRAHTLSVNLLNSLQMSSCSYRIQSRNNRRI